MRLNNSINNGFKVLAFGVVWAPRKLTLGKRVDSWLLLAGDWMVGCGICLFTRQKEN
jgi:hypothetical protein